MVKIFFYSSRGMSLSLAPDALKAFLSLFNCKCFFQAEESKMAGYDARHIIPLNEKTGMLQLCLAGRDNKAWNLDFLFSSDEMSTTVKGPNLQMSSSKQLLAFHTAPLSSVQGLPQ